MSSIRQVPIFTKRNHPTPFRELLFPGNTSIWHFVERAPWREVDLLRDVINGNCLELGESFPSATQPAGRVTISLGGGDWKTLIPEPWLLFAMCSNALAQVTSSANCTMQLTVGWSYPQPVTSILLKKKKKRITLTEARMPRFKSKTQHLLAMVIRQVA